jgi:hypothetical protein
MTIELVPLCEATVTLTPPEQVSASLVIAEVTAVEAVGERLRATLHGNAAADWLKISPEGYGTLDVKVTLETDDGAIIHAAYYGRMHLDSMTVYAAPQFHTGDERYLWINRIQVIAKGTFNDKGQLCYEMYELR